METITKICCNCGQEKPIDEFVKDNRKKDGHSTLCKECKRARDRKRYDELKNDPEYHKKKLESGAKYRKTHKEQIQKYSSEYNMRPEVVDRKAEWHQNKKANRDIHGQIVDMVIRAKARAIEKGVPFDITVDDVEFVEICPLLNIPLNWNHGPRVKNTPSLDRIIPEKGYVKGNIRIISNLANMMKSYASNEELRTFAKNINVYMENEDIVRPTENIESVELEDKEPLS